MSFAFLKTIAFRNLADTETDIRGKEVFLVGENGQGKTNFLEALYFCSYGSSFRGSRDRDLAREGERDFFTSVILEGSINSNVSVSFKDCKKSINLDGKKIEDRKELLSVIPSIVFCHEDMEFVAGTPERRRWFFDQTRSIWDPLYLEDLRNYRHVLKTRNSVLHGAAGRRGPLSAEDAATLDALDPQLVRYGLELAKKRAETAEEFSRFFEPLYRDISGIAGIGVKYLPSWKEEGFGPILDQLSGRREADLKLGVSVSGPHRDRYVFIRRTSPGEAEDFSGRASTGQRRLLALLLRIAQTRIFSDRTGKKPILLLDDVLLELDGEKRRKFLAAMPEYEQAFFTFLPEEPFSRYRKSGTIVYIMNRGCVTRETPV